MLGKHVQDEGRPIYHPDVVAQNAFQLALVSRGELFVEQDDVRLIGLYQELDFLDLAGADEGLGIRMFDALRGLAHHAQAGRLRQQCQLPQRILQCQQVLLISALGADQQGALARRLGWPRLFGHGPIIAEGCGRPLQGWRFNQLCSVLPTCSRLAGETLSSVSAWVCQWG